MREQVQSELKLLPPLNTLVDDVPILSTRVCSAGLPHGDTENEDEARADLMVSAKAQFLEDGGTLEEWAKIAESVDETIRRQREVDRAIAGAETNRELQAALITRHW